MRALAAALLCLCCAAVPPTEQQAQRLQLAHAQLESGNAESARRELSALLAEEPELDSARLLLGFTYYALGDKTAAESAFRQVLLDSLEAKALEGLVAVAPNSSGARLLLLLHGATPETLARCLDVLPSQELLPHLQDLVAQNPNAGNLFLLAAALHRSGDYEHAVRAYERAWYLGSDEVKPATLAGLHQHLGQVEDALLWLDRASDSDTPERRIMRAELLETTGELAEAQTIARVLIEDGAHTERALNVLIRTLPADAPNSEIAPLRKACDCCPNGHSRAPCLAPRRGSRGRELLCELHKPAALGHSVPSGFGTGAPGCRPGPRGTKCAGDTGRRPWPAAANQRASCSELSGFCRRPRLTRHSPRPA